ncbi:MAG: hypothetical protein L6265_11400 [Thermoplasmatales archaeon]|nr:hypothetical protein [Thermoplasmatales archaeon]
MHIHLKNAKKVIVDGIKAATIVFVIFLAVTVIPSLVEELCEPSSHYIEDKIIYLSPGEKEQLNLTTKATDSTFIWEWDIKNFSNDKISFKIIDYNGKEYNNITTSPNFTSEQGFYNVKHEGTYSFVWENQNENKSVTLQIKKISEYRDVGGKYCYVILVVSLIAVVFLYFLLREKGKIKKEKGERKSKLRYIAISIILILIIFMLFTSPVICYCALPPDKVETQIQPNSEYSKEYSSEKYNLVEGGCILWDYNASVETKDKPVSFWIEDNKGHVYSYYQTNASTSNKIGFVVPHDGDYWIICNNPTNKTVNLTYSFGPETSFNEALIESIDGIASLLFILISFVTTYRVIRTRRLKKIEEIGEYKQRYDKIWYVSKRKFNALMVWLAYDCVGTILVKDGLLSFISKRKSIDIKNIKSLSLIKRRRGCWLYILYVFIGLGIGLYIQLFYFHVRNIFPIIHLLGCFISAFVIGYIVHFVPLWIQVKFISAPGKEKEIFLSKPNFYRLWNINKDTKVLFNQLSKLKEE